jgi:hypothetical protein
MVLAPFHARLALVLAPAALALAALGCGSPPPPAAPAPVATAEEAEPKPEMGSLEILCNPPTKVAVDGKEIGVTPIKNHKVEPGSHDVTFMDEESGNRTMSVNVGPGEGRTVISDRPPVAGVGAAPPPKKK